MFTGIIGETGKIASLQRHGEGYRISIKSEKILKELALGDSIAVNGICLTVTWISDNSFSADISRETYERTSIPFSKEGFMVNLETPCKPDSFLSGHIVSGHIDTTAVITGIHKKKEFCEMTFELKEARDRKYIIEKGSIAVNGVSLTIYNVQGSIFSVSIIPETSGRTSLPHLSEGMTVNIEFDIIGKYIIKWLEERPETRNSNISSLLHKSGFI